MGSPYKMYNTYKRVLHICPLIALGIISFVSITTIKCTLMWWPPVLYGFVPSDYRSYGGAINLLVFLTLTSCTVLFFLKAMFIGPGHVPSSWHPIDSFCVREYIHHDLPLLTSNFNCNGINITDTLQFCEICKHYKAPRSHHCRKCNSCILKMDHHCPWINNCVGHFNHACFTLFLYFATIASFYASVIMTCSLYQAINADWYMYFGNPYQPFVYFDITEFIVCILALALAIGVIISVGAQCILQLKSIVKNRTGIEDWIIEKAKYRRQRINKCEKYDFIPEFVHPYNLGFWKNLSEVFTLSCQPLSDGIVWNVKEGCSQFSLTLEQVLQKEEKHRRTREYVVIKKYSGSKFPVSFGFNTCLRPPCTDDPRIPLDVGDSIKVTRSKDYWLYGQKVSELNSCKGWFPRSCAVPKVEFSSKKIS